METWTRDEILAARKARGNRPGKAERARMRKKQKQQEQREQQEQQHIPHHEYEKLVHEKKMAEKRALVAENRAHVAENRALAAEQRAINILVHHHSASIPLNKTSTLQEKVQIYDKKRKRGGKAESGKQEYHRQQYFSRLQKAYYGFY